MPLLFKCYRSGPLGNNGMIQFAEGFVHCSKVFAYSMSPDQFDEDCSQLRWSLLSIAMKITREVDEDCHFVGKTGMLICVVSQRTIGPCVSTGQNVVTEQEYRKTYKPDIDMI